jgi:ubiquinone biosynthesis protein
MIGHAAPFVRQMLARRLSPDYLAKIAWRQFQEVKSLLEIMPGETRDILRKLSRGKLKLEFEHLGLEPLGRSLDRITNRLSFSLIIAALIIASSLIMQTKTGYLFMGYPVLGLVGFLLAGGLGFWLAVAILRSGRF